jgi:hypothetical protein
MARNTGAINSPKKAAHSLKKKKKAAHLYSLSSITFFAERILALEESYDGTNHHNKNESYNFVFNLQTVLTARQALPLLPGPDIVGCRWEVTERV